MNMAWALPRDAVDPGHVAGPVRGPIVDLEVRLEGELPLHVVPRSV